MSVRHIHRRYQAQIEQVRKDNAVHTVFVGVACFIFGMIAMIPLY